MTAEERSLTDDNQLRRFSSYVTQDGCRISDYNTFERDEVPERNELKKRKLIVITICLANLFVGVMKGLVAPFYAVEVRWLLCVV